MRGTSASVGGHFPESCEGIGRILPPAPAPCLALSERVISLTGWISLSTLMQKKKKKDLFLHIFLTSEKLYLGQRHLQNSKISIRKRVTS